MAGKPTRAKTALEAARGGGVATVIAPAPTKRRVGRFKGNLKGVGLACALMIVTCFYKTPCFGRRIDGKG